MLQVLERVTKCSCCGNSARSQGHPSLYAENVMCRGSPFSVICANSLIETAHRCTNCVIYAHIACLKILLQAPVWLGAALPAAPREWKYIKFWRPNSSDNKFDQNWESILIDIEIAFKKEPTQIWTCYFSKTTAELWDCGWLGLLISCDSQVRFELCRQNCNVLAGLLGFSNEWSSACVENPPMTLL